MGTKVANEQHEAFFQDFAQVLKKHAGHLDSLEMLTIASNAVGKLVAFQDQRKHSPGYIMTVVAENIKLGNQQAVDALRNKTEGSA
jgi:hypothetical protein